MTGSGPNQLFADVLRQLNPAQRLAVDRIEGPVLVVAGPGTGKTHILAARVGRILEETDAQPHNILCLTFSDAGVVAMRNRLLKFIGPTAHRVHIYTFHSFCNKIIQENLGLFGRHYLEPLDELERIDLIREVLHQLPADHPMRRTTLDGYFYQQHLKDLFRRMKQERWEEKELLQRIDDYVASLRSRPDFLYQRAYQGKAKGDLREAKFEAEVLRMERLKAAIPLFEQYQEAMARRGRYDFEDMILWVLEAFKSYPALLRTYQEQYLYLLVDEYQDTNGAQNQVLRSLIEYWESPNVFIVGDDDQSIYEFQGARLKNLTDFYQDHSDFLQTVVLRENYRSTSSILDLAGHLIQYNEKRLLKELSDLGLEKKLTASGAYAASSVQPRLVVYGNQLQETAGIVQQIEAALESGVPADEIAVIYAEHKQVEQLLEVLVRKGIPVHLRRQPNALDEPLLLRVRTLLAYLSAERKNPGSGDPHLFRILHFRNWGIAPEDLARLNERRKSALTESGTGFRSWLYQQKQEAGVGLQTPEKLWYALEVLDELLSSVDRYSVLRLVETLLNDSGIIREVLEEEEREPLLSALYSLLGFIRQQAARNPRLQLEDLLDLLRRMDANRIPLPMLEVLPPSAGVQLMTAHSSKGLEFQYVFLMDCQKKTWEPRSSNGRYRFSFPDTITFSGEEDALEARRRLFYVAITRAKEVLQISYHNQDHKGKEVQAALFVDELLASGALQQEPPIVSSDYVQAVRNGLLAPGFAAGISVYSRDRIAGMLEGFALSVSSLYTYLRCPLSFFYEHILKVPRLQSEAASFGTAMHNSLQWLYDRMLANRQRQFPELSQLLQHFVREMDRQQAWFGPAVFQQKKELGQQYLEALYARGVRSWIKNARVEVDIRHAEWKGVPIKGVIDKIEYLPDSKVRLVDYKTGRANKDRLRGPTKARPEGGPYWRQLVFYKILFESRRIDEKVASTGRIAYLEPNEKGDFEQIDVNLDQSAVEALSTVLTDTYARIMDQQFSGCGESNCTWCNFEKHQVHPDLRIAPPEEGLDDQS
jgi:DNA helicase-2/ATP-dependent DNA helicase PcrA